MGYQILSWIFYWFLFTFSNRGTNGGGISVTQSSGSPYLHGRPRFPVQQQQQQQQPGLQLQYPNYTFSTGVPTAATTQQQQLELQQMQLQQQQQQYLNGQGGYLQQGLSTNGFTPATLSVPSNSMSMQQQLQQQQQQHQSLPVQSIRPIQPVQVFYKNFSKMHARANLIKHFTT